MKWASAASKDVSLDRAIEESTQAIAKQLDHEPPDLVMVFVSDHYEAMYERVPKLLAPYTGKGLLIGCSAGGVIGGGEEIEGRPGVSLTAAVLPDVELTPIRMLDSLIPDPAAPAEVWEELLHIRNKQEHHFILLPDPYSFDAEKFLSGLDAAFPNSCKVGGVVSGGQQAGSNALYFGKKSYRDGLVGVALSGNIMVDTLVAQGCRPVGSPMFITRCAGNRIQELDGQAPLIVLQKLYKNLEDKDQQLFSTSLFLGVVMKDSLQQYQQGDFLIRNVMGLESETQALIVGAEVQEKSVVQFHLRDANTSTIDLNQMLSRYVAGPGKARPEGSLLFSCMGRGMNLYGHSNHDSDALKKYLGELPLGGFFCSGEIGPVHGKTFLHGYTSSFGLFKSRHS